MKSVFVGEIIKLKDTMILMSRGKQLDSKKVPRKPVEEDFENRSKEPDVVKDVFNDEVVIQRRI